MTASSFSAIGYAGHRITADVAADAADVVDRVWRFVRPHFTVEPTEPGATAPVHVAFRSRDRWSAPSAEAEPTLVRKARNPTKHVWGRCWRRAGAEVIEVPQSGTVFELSADGGSATVYVSDRSQYHASDFVRDLMWDLALATGRFIHASAVAWGGEAIAFAGEKGAGKTTTAIDFLTAGAAFATGDVLHLRFGSEGECHSFPDFPHVGWGTLRSFPEMAGPLAELGLEEGADGDKILLPHDWYETSLGAKQAAAPLLLKAIVLPQVDGPGAPVIEPAEADPDCLASMPRETTDPDQGYEPFLRRARERAGGGGPAETDLSGFAALRWYRRTGFGRLSPEAMAAVLGSDPA